jgi:hypothetical protein
METDIVETNREEEEQSSMSIQGIRYPAEQWYRHRRTLEEGRSPVEGRQKARPRA